MKDFKFRSIEPGQVSTTSFHASMLATIAPRPIALVSSINSKGQVNLSPFSFFNAFGSKPPILVFSPARRVRDNTIKHTLENAFETREVVVNVVNYAIVEQVSLSSCEYEREVNEFIKAGLTPLSSFKVKPPRVAESPAQFECKVIDVIETGQEGGAGNLVICEILYAHFNDQIYDSQDVIQPQKLDLVARMGGDWYCRASGESLFQVPKPNVKKGIGFDQIPTSVLYSDRLTGNDLGRLANIVSLPDAQVIEQFKHSLWFKEQGFSNSMNELERSKLFGAGKEFLSQNDLEKAWCCFLIFCEP